MPFYRYKPSKTKRIEFAKKMQEIEAFCLENGISASSTNDSYYFTLNGQHYRVSNHTIEQSNRRAYDWEGNQIREKYHDDTRDPNVVYITAGKTRIMEIYNDLKAGYTLDKRGNRVSEAKEKGREPGL